MAGALTPWAGFCRACGAEAVGPAVRRSPVPEGSTLSDTGVGPAFLISISGPKREFRSNHSRNREPLSEKVTGCEPVTILRAIAFNRSASSSEIA